MTNHPAPMNEVCPNQSNISNMEKTLDRLVDHVERQAVAMEEIARNTILLAKHEKQLDQVGEDLQEIFGRLRSLEMKKAEDRKVCLIEERLRIIETKCAEKTGEKKVAIEDKNFKNQIKIAVLPYVIGGAFLIIYLMDKFDVPQSISKWLKEMN